MKSNSKWKFAVDKGGTFTDVIGLDPHGNYHTLKLLSNSPDYKDASIEGIGRMLNFKNKRPLPEDKIEAVRLGTTAATNALLERKGGRVALFITKGFSDLLKIGYQNRPDIFSLCIKKPASIYSSVFEVDERIDQKGKVIKTINLQKLEEDIETCKQLDADAIAVVLMHAWKNPDHEIICEQMFKKHGIANPFLSHKTMDLIKIVTRGQSTVVDAYLSPVIDSYVDEIKKESGEIPVEFIRSSGGISKPDSFKGKDAILSGPAGGVIAVENLVHEMGLKGAVGFDMGGTSTDVSRYKGKLGKVYEKIIGGIEFQVEMLNISTVAAGGGSVLWFDGQRMRVGPESAGANPGPACYGFGGPLTITDANLLTGRISPEHFPQTFGSDRLSALNEDIVKEKFQRLTEKINIGTLRNYSPRQAALGFIRIANEKMAMAIKEISVSKGYDVRDYALVCFGGAGGQHACEVASLLGMGKVIFHPLGGVMSAYGIGLSKPTKKSSMSVLCIYNRENHKKLLSSFDKMEERLIKEKNNKKEDFLINREIDLRHEGTGAFLTVECSNYEDVLESFKKQHERIFGFYPENKPVEAVNLRIEAKEKGDFFNTSHIVPELKLRNKSIPEKIRKIYYSNGFVDAPLSLRENISPKTKVKGPAFVVDRYSTLVIDPGFDAEAEQNGVIVVKKMLPLIRQEPGSESNNPNKNGKPDPVLLEVFNNLFMGIATEMGHTLRNTAHSVNIKERLDFSCAVFDGTGDLVANAPHMPVHLGSMADTVKAVIKSEKGSIKQGDIYLSNNPYHGGSHLPDLNVVCPVFSQNDEIVFFTVARGHHADIGGITPGSMPPAAEHIDEEGILIDGFLLVRDGILREEELRQILSTHKHPVRNMEERISDLKAQIASCNKGVHELKKTIALYGWDTARDYMGFIKENAAYSVKQALAQFLKTGDPFEAAFEDHLDDGTLLKVKVVIKGGINPPKTVNAEIDFTGTGPGHSNDNLNTPISVTRSAVLYVLRALTDSDIPLNSGCLQPIRIVIPDDSILSPVYPLPVASGNVETSQRITDVLLGALKAAAASQGTMNNLLFQVEGETPYYETIAGGSGASDGCPGTSGIQVHMTNTRITDPEILEMRHPGVRLEKFVLRKGSGGKGRFAGGDGTIRELKFLKPAKISIISERRVYAPYGLADGKPGKKGVNLLKKTNGEIVELPHRVVKDVKKGDSIIIKTPGGGGFGKSKL